MKRQFLISTAGLAIFTSVAFSAQELNLGGGQVGDARYEQAIKEAERNKELLEIWKEHVRTLTDERNAAYKELESLKAGQSSVDTTQQFGGVETMPIPSGAMMGSGENFQAEIAALKEQNENISRQLRDAESDKDLLIREKEEALSQLERARQSSQGPAAPAQPNQSYRNLLNNYEAQKQKLASVTARVEEAEAEARSLREELERAKSQSADIADTSSVNEALITERDDARRQVRELTYQNETLKAKSDKLEVLEKELEDTRAYLSPKIQQLEEQNQALSEKTKTLEEENQSLRKLYSGADSQSRRKQMEAENLTKKLKDLSDEHEKLIAERDGLQTSAASTAREMAELRSGLESLKAASQRSELLEKQLAQSQEEIQALKGANEVLEKANDEFKANQAQQAKAIEALKTNLRSNLSDIQNFKTNLESYLESLQSNFQERQN